MARARGIQQQMYPGMFRQNQQVSIKVPDSRMKLIEEIFFSVSRCELESFVFGIPVQLIQRSHIVFVSETILLNLSITESFEPNILMILV